MAKAINSEQTYSNALAYVYKYSQNEDSDGLIKALPLFWTAFFLKHEKVPLELYQTYNYGNGVVKNKYISHLMFGIAQKLKDSRCNEEIKELNVDKHLLSKMGDIIDAVWLLFNKSHLYIESPKKGTSEVYDSGVLYYKNVPVPGQYSMAEHIIGHIPNDYVFPEDFEIPTIGDGNDSCCIIL